LQFRPYEFDSPLYYRLTLPNGQRVGDISNDPLEIERYCQAQFRQGWLPLKFAALQALSARLSQIEGRISPLKALLNAGQPASTLRPVFHQIIDSLQTLVADGSLNAQLLMGAVQLSIGCYFSSGLDDRKGRDAVREAIRLGNPHGYFLLGDCFLEAGKVDDAIGAYEEGLSQGCRVCCYQLAQLTENGSGSIVRDVQAAFTLYRRAYHESYPPAAVGMVRLWLRSSEELPLPGEPTVIIEEAQASGCDGATLLLAELHESGEGGRFRPASAVSLYRCAAIQGDPDAQVKLADMLADSSLSELKITTDENEAQEWYLRVCAADENSQRIRTHAHMELGRLLMWKKEYFKAAHHFFNAYQLGDASAGELQRLCEQQSDAEDQSPEVS
jgi:TPR repeat protein